jgi:tRNA(Ile)-lysidine synthase
MVVAVSGGPDSVGLLRVLHEITQVQRTAAPLIVAHVNHGLRGVESEADERFVRQLAESLELEFHVSRLQARTEEFEAHNPSSNSNSIRSSSEESLRDARYHAILEIAKKTDARYIATGHTKNDQIETILFRIFRGTGINGLTGIPELRVVEEAISIVRPLMSVTKREILDALREVGQEFRQDDSNSESLFTRNFLRNEILPQIRERFKSVDDAIARLGVQANENQEFVDSEAAKLNPAIINQSPQRIELDCRILAAVSQVLVRQFLIQVWNQQQWPLQSMTFEWWNQIAEAIQDLESRAVLNLPDSIRMARTEHHASFVVQNQ